MPQKRRLVALRSTRYIEEIVESRPAERSVGINKPAVSEATDRILELREGTNLGGLSIKDLIQEGRKH